MNTVTVNIHATIIKGALKGVSGRVVGFDSEMDIVSIEVDENTWIETKSNYIKQN
ncbi:hypothetical protein [Bacillus manliponensis]|uniref:hypothetical protein n=1 Tax=Bacillus manliponensis TaxID=574376 RepID=UPI000A7DA942|nr:hypothetical protein [Bacillus manliponensis]